MSFEYKKDNGDIIVSKPPLASSVTQENMNKSND